MSLVNTLKIKKNQGFGLENFLKNAAMDEEKENLNRTYLVRDKLSKELVAYFSLKSDLFSIGKWFFMVEKNHSYSGN